MTREELRDYVEEQRNLGVIPYHVYSTLIDGIDTLEQEPKTKWIPVSERLPKAFETVLRTRVENGWNGTTYTIVDTGCICPADYNIIAWMPLPEPYKKGGE